jgi:hypothetical protein
MKQEENNLEKEKEKTKQTLMNVLNLAKSLKLSTYVTLDLGSIKKFITNQIKKLVKANKKNNKKIKIKFDWKKTKGGEIVKKKNLKNDFKRNK